MKKIVQREDIPRLYTDEGLSTVQISKLVGLSVGAVGSILKVRGVKLRTPKEALKKRFPNGAFGSLASNWKGGRRKANNDGYIMIYSPDHPHCTKARYVMEHILVAEKKMCRYLKKGEIVHHIDGNKTNNSPDNLEVIMKVDHVRHHFAAVQEVARLKKILDNHGVAY